MTNNRDEELAPYKVIVEIIEALSNEIATRNSGMQALEKKNSALYTEKEALEENNKTQQDNYQRRVEEIAARNSQIKTLETRISTLNAEQKHLATERDNLKNKNRAQRERYDKTVEDLKTEGDRYKEKADEYDTICCKLDFIKRKKGLSEQYSNEKLLSEIIKELDDAITKQELAKTEKKNYGVYAIISSIVLAAIAGGVFIFQSYPPPILSSQPAHQSAHHREPDAHSNYSSPVPKEARNAEVVSPELQHLPQRADHKYGSFTGKELGELRGKLEQVAGGLGGEIGELEQVAGEWGREAEEFEQLGRELGARPSSLTGIEQPTTPKDGLNHNYSNNLTETGTVKYGKISGHALAGLSIPSATEPVPKTYIVDCGYPVVKPKFAKPEHWESFECRTPRPDEECYMAFRYSTPEIARDANIKRGCGRGMECCPPLHDGGENDQQKKEHDGGGNDQPKKE